MSARSRIRTILIGAAAALGAAGVVVVSVFPPSPNNLDMDCNLRVVDGGVAPSQTGRCRIVAAPNVNAPPDQCVAVLGTGGEPPGIGQDAGLPNARVRVERAFESFRANGVVDTWHCEPLPDGGAGGCWCDLGCSVSVDAQGHYDGPCAALHDVVDAQGLGSIFKPGRPSVRPAYALRGGCRAHVLAGEDPCASSVGFDAGPDPSDAGP